MREFIKYQHIERFGTDEVEGIELGDCYIFPKIDGTNGSVWYDKGNIKAGSRNRELTLENDNAGFYAYVLQNENIKQYLYEHPEHRLFGEWLVPHSLKTYRDEAWRKFYVFDVCIDKDDGSLEYIPYDIYKPMLDEFKLDYIPPLAKGKNLTYEKLIKLLEQNNYLVKDGQGTGEGVVIKNYDYYNKYKRQTWAKIVTSEFKEKHIKEMGCSEIKSGLMMEEKIVDEFCTEAFISKELEKIREEQGGWSSKYIPMLLGKVFYELVKEEVWNVVKKFNNPTINFKTLNTLVIQKIKQTKQEIFN